MEQIYRRRAVSKGNGEPLVQRAVRGIAHCAFTYAEQTSAFEALPKWEQRGIKPDGDEVLDRAAVANANYGCKFTQNTFTADEITAGDVPNARALIASCPR